jgi:uncharacterized LabA/DUF88 family protein
MLQERTYVFVDGNYLRKVADGLMQEMFGVDAELNFDAIRPGNNVRRVFYYDCLNDLRLEGEPDSEFDARVSRQEAIFSSIQCLRGFHVRLGSVSGSRRKLRQKKVDVLLAVDALEHAFRGNMSHFCLIAGDLDFAPLIDCLVRIGTYVEVVYERRSAAVDLYRAADSSQEMTFSTVYCWTTKEFQSQHPIPRGYCGGGLPSGYTQIKSGAANGRAAGLYKSTADYLLAAERFDANNFTLFLHFPDVEFLEKYFRLVHGPLHWS